MAVYCSGQPLLVLTGTTLGLLVMESAKTRMGNIIIGATLHCGIIVGLIVLILGWSKFFSANCLVASFEMQKSTLQRRILLF